MPNKSKPEIYPEYKLLSPESFTDDELTLLEMAVDLREYEEFSMFLDSPKIGPQEQGTWILASYLHAKYRKNCEKGIGDPRSGIFGTKKNGIGDTFPLKELKELFHDQGHYDENCFRKIKLALLERNTVLLDKGDYILETEELLMDIDSINTLMERYITFLTTVMVIKEHSDEAGQFPEEFIKKIISLDANSFKLDNSQKRKQIESSEEKEVEEKNDVIANNPSNNRKTKKKK